MFVPKYPTYIGIDITNRCNYQCAYCIVDGGKSDKELSTQQLYTLLDEAYSLGVRHLGISGGEPFIYPKFINILDSCLKRFGVNVVTNGSLIDNDLAKTLGHLSYESNLSVRVSLDGASADVHEIFRDKGTYKTAISAIQNLLKYEVPVGVYTVLHKKNLSKFYEFLGFMRSMGVNIVRVLPLFPMGRGTELMPYILNKQEWWDLLKSKDSLEKEFMIRILAESPLDFLASSSHNIKAKPCLAGYLYLGIAPNGDVFPCPYMMDVVLGNIQRNTLLDIWSNSPILASLRDSNGLKGSCTTCQYKEKCRGGCRGLSYHVYGDFSYPDPYCPIANKEIAKKSISSCNIL